MNRAFATSGWSPASAPLTPGVSMSGAVGSVALRPLPVAINAAQRTVIIVAMSAALIAVAAPYPLTKYILGTVLAIYWAALLVDFDERFVGLYVLLLPTLQLAPLETLGISGLNWQSVFLVIFAIAAARGSAPPVPTTVPRWIAYFAVALVLSACYSWLVVQKPFYPLLTGAKNWLFPFALFVLGRRCFKDRHQLWFLILCVAIVSFAQALHGLRDGVLAGNLLSNRPTGLLTGQANLFAGYLAMYGLLFLFTTRTAVLGRAARLSLTATALIMLMTLVFTLSRGAWLAFAVTAALFGFTTSPKLVVLLIAAVLVGQRWAPEEAVTRTDLTVQAVETADGELEESLDDSAALRVIQWKAFPQMISVSPIWGTGQHTYPEQLRRATGISRSAHAMMVHIGTEMGVIGLLGYLGLLGSVVIVCGRRVRSAGKGTLERALGLGLVAATVCLFLLDFSGTRFRAHALMTYFWLLVGSYLANTDTPPRSSEAA